MDPEVLWCKKGRDLSDLAKMRVGTRVNAEQAPKPVIARIDPRAIMGRLEMEQEASDKSTTHFYRALAPVRMEERSSSNTGSRMREIWMSVLMSGGEETWVMVEIEAPEQVRKIPVTATPSTVSFSP